METKCCSGRSRSDARVVRPTRPATASPLPLSLSNGCGTIVYAVAHPLTRTSPVLQRTALTAGACPLVLPDEAHTYIIQIIASRQPAISLFWCPLSMTSTIPH